MTHSTASHRVLTTWLAISLTWLMASSATAEPAAVISPSFTPESLWQWAWVGDPRLAPDGRRAVYDRITVDVAGDGYASDIWLVDLVSGAQRQLTSHPAAETGARWSPDGSHLAFVSARVDPPQLFVLDLDAGGEARQVTHLSHGVANPAWAPDGRSIAFQSRALPTADAERAEDRKGADREAREAPRRELLGDEAELETAPAEFATERLRFRQDGRPGYLADERRHLWLVELDTGATRRLTSGPYDHGAPHFTADGRSVIFAADRRADADRTFHEADVYRVAIGSPTAGPGDVEQLTHARGPQTDPLPSPDGRWIAATGYPVEARPPSYRDDGLWLLNAATGELSELTTGYDRAIGDGAGNDVAPPRGAVQRIRWSQDGRSLVATSARDGAVDLIRVHVDGSVETLIDLDQGTIHSFDLVQLADGRERAVLLASFPRRPFELYTVEIGADRPSDPTAWTRLTDTLGPTFGADGFAPYEELSIESFDGRMIQGWLVKPPDFDPSRQYPMVLYIHGGPHTMYGSVFFHEFQVLAAAGYVVLFTNPRGSTGYGSDFANIIQYRYPGDDFRDLMAAVDAVLERGDIDPRRLGVAGGSGGGLLTTWTVAHTDRFAAAVAQRNVTNWHSFVGTSDFNQAFVDAWFPGMPWQERDNYFQRSPLFHVDKVETPVLLIHSEQDYRTPLEQSLQFYVALKMRRQAAKLVIFPEEPHGLSRMGRPSHRIARLHHILDWFDRYLALETVLTRGQPSTDAEPGKRKTAGDP